MTRAALAAALVLILAPSCCLARPGVGVEGFDSGTRIVREVAEALTGEGRSILECYPSGSRFFLGAISLLPERMRIAAIEWGMRLSVGHPRERADHVRVAELAQWCVDQYPRTG
ncbi:MAG: hypothetical protein JSW65_05125, partial [Candidatus Bipolaricaulota bacterium]